VRILLSILAVLMLVPTWSGSERLPLLTGTPAVTMKPVALYPDQPERRRLGPLTYLGGVEIAARDPAFGGYSAIAVAGRRLTLLSDGGLTLAFDLDAAMRPSNIRFGALPDGPGTGWEKSDRDSESMAVDPATGRIWVGFEDANAIWRYAPGFARAEAQRAPRAMRRWRQNGGPEAMVRLRSGRFLVFAEEQAPGRKGPGRGLIFPGDPTDAAPPAPFTYVAERGYNPTDAAELPDGRILVVERRLALGSGFTAILRIVPAHVIRAGAIVRAKTVARFEAPVLHDNFEGLAISQAGGRTIVWLVSDDNNHGWFQRTLLLKLRLD
jgi:hypothetical protein